MLQSCMIKGAVADVARESVRGCSSHAGWHESLSVALCRSWRGVDVLECVSHVRIYELLSFGLGMRLCTVLVLPVQEPASR